MSAANVRRRGMGSPEPRTRAARGLTAGRLGPEPAAFFVTAGMLAATAAVASLWLTAHTLHIQPR